MTDPAAAPHTTEPGADDASGARTPAQRARDEAAGFVIDGDMGGDFQRFSQKNDIFSRSFWDPAIRSAKSDRFYATYRTELKNWKAAEGFTQKDYALRNATWHVTDIFAELKEDENRREGYLDEFTVQRPARRNKFLLSRLPP